MTHADYLVTLYCKLSMNTSFITHDCGTQT